MQPWRKISYFARTGLVAALAAGIGLPALAQGIGTATVVAPRLEFSPEEMALARAVANDPALAAFYGGNGLRPIFAGPEGQARRQALDATLTQAPAHGLPPRRYDLSAVPLPASAGTARIEDEIAQARVLARWMHDLTGGMVRPDTVDAQNHRQVSRAQPIDAMMRDFVQAPDPLAYLNGLAPDDPRYLALQTALAQQARLIAPADAPRAPDGLWRAGMRDARLGDLRARLASIGFMAPAAGDPAVYDDGLAEAVTAFQQAAGLPADGVAGPKTIGRLNGGPDWQTRRILVALERMRWMGGHDLNARHVWVNIPEFSARIYDGGHQEFITRVVVGKTDHDQQTPEFSDEMEYVVVNPRWNVPRSITVKEYLPRLQANPNAVGHLDILDRRGRVIPRSQIDFGKYTAANFPYRMQQKPSDDNALGLVKFIFPNRWNIYLHDTPTKHLFGNRVRAYSHGCVRVGDPFDLSYALLSQQSSDPQGMFRRALNSGRETFLELKPHVPVHLVYFTAFPDENGQMRYYNDIYNRDPAVWQAMAKAGLETAPENN